MTRIQIQARCRAAFWWAMGFVIVGEYTCKEVPFGSLPWVAAGLVLACVGVLGGAAFLNSVFDGSDRADPDKLGAALARLGTVAMAGIVLCLLLGWVADGELLFNVAVAGGDFAFGLFVLWTQFWFIQPADEPSAPRRPG